MFERLEMLNETLLSEGRKPLRMGIGLAAGDGVVGNVGTATRHGYSAVGDAVNVAARLQSMCKPLGMRLIATAPIRDAAGELFAFEPLGALELAGHDPVTAFGVPEREFVTSGLRQKLLGGHAPRA
jgi:adenylate cyclase